MMETLNAFSLEPTPSTVIDARAQEAQGRRLQVDVVTTRDPVCPTCEEPLADEHTRTCLLELLDFRSTTTSEFASPTAFTRWAIVFSSCRALKTPFHSEPPSVSSRRGTGVSGIDPISRNHT